MACPIVQGSWLKPVISWLMSWAVKMPAYGKVLEEMVLIRAMVLPVKFLAGHPFQI